MTTTPTAAAAEAPKNKGLNLALWIVQALLALAFLGAGMTKITTPMDELLKQPWAQLTPEPLIRFIGVAEVAGALGLLLPSLARILPILTPIAAIGLSTVMVLALGVHAKLGEAPMIGVTAVLGSLAAFVAWGRLKKAPIRPRS